MKFSRILAASAGVALLGASTLLTAGAANAADLYPAAPFPAETSPYSAGWFVGGGSTGTATSGVAGLSVTGPYQLLNGTTPTDSLVTLVNEGALVSTGSANFQIALWNDGTANTGFATIRSDNYGPTSLNVEAGWRSSGPVGGIPANETHTLTEFQAALDANSPDYELLAYGFNVPAGQTAVVSAVNWAGDTQHFTPAPVSSGPTTVTRAAVLTSGYTATSTGFVPGETVDVGYSTGETGDHLDFVVADENGRVTYTLVATADSFAVGEYSLVFNTYGVNGTPIITQVVVPFAVIADPAVTTPAVLAATGTDMTAGSIAAVLLLLVGGTFGIVAARRRSARN